MIDSMQEFTQPRRGVMFIQFCHPFGIWEFDTAFYSPTIPSGLLTA